MTLTKVCMLAVLGICACTVIKQWKSDFLPLLRLSLVLVLGTVLITSATPVLAFVRTLTESTHASPYTELLFKALGIAILTQICSDICRECGESALSGGVELTGKLEILLLSLPMVSEILSMAEQLLSMGGGT